MLVSSRAAGAVHNVEVADDWIKGMARTIERATAIAEQAIIGAGRIERVDAAAAADLRRQAQNLGRVSRSFERQLQVGVRLAAEASQASALGKLKRERAKTGRAEQPESFISASGAQVGVRVRLRRSVKNAVAYEQAGPFTIPVTIKVGLLSELEKAKDKQGTPVWPFVEYPWRKAPKNVRGLFYTAGKTSAPGAGGGDAVFVPSVLGGSLTVRKLHRGYGFLQAGRERANEVLLVKLTAIDADISRQIVSISRAIEKAAKRANARSAGKAAASMSAGRKSRKGRR